MINRMISLDVVTAQTWNAEEAMVCFDNREETRTELKAHFSYELESIGNLSITVNAGEEWGSCISVLEAGERWALTRT
jgi:hypothetical protein